MHREAWQNSEIEAAAPFISAVASVMWAVFAFTVLAVFRKDISGLLRRLSKASILGQSVELNNELDRLEAKAEVLVDGLPQLQQAAAEIFQPNGESSSPPENGATTDTDVVRIEEIIQSILQIAKDSPKLALMNLSAELEKKARQALAVRGILKGRRALSLSQALKELEQYGFPTQLTGSLRLFSDVRNRIVHAVGDTKDEAVRALDSGIVILKTLDSLPAEINVVRETSIPLYEDENCSHAITDAMGVMLETTSPGGASTTKRVFPTTQTHFEKGRAVAWEWNDKRQWGAAWFRDPETNAPTHAYNGSMEFVGRHLRDI